MLKNILLSGLLCTLLSAQNFDDFLQNAITHSPYLESSALGIKQADESGNALKRYANPTLELEYSKFDPSVGQSNNGYRVNISQPLRLWSVGNDKQALSHNMVRTADANYVQDKARFTRDISLAFNFYAQQKMMLTLGDEELRIAKKIYEISKARYESGTISRGLLLQAKVDYEMVMIANEALMLKSSQSYYNLLSFAGITEEIGLETEYSFTLISKQKGLNPDLRVLKSKQDTALSLAKVNSNSVEWMNVFGEFESEPNQDIMRFGMNFPLAVFNTKSQEKNIAKLQAAKSEFLYNNETRRLAMQDKRLKNEHSSLQKQEEANKQILQTELELLKMYEDGYKIASFNLLQLQDIKNKVIQTKERLIQITSALNQNAITQNYNQGNYND
ncbi:TolC family protein [Sulfurimonas sp. MAG313]|nr:TolC family protein [Sulfurimonas sp. MAG313]MDF1881331.1 TolC family protein [Sulfurimonas sp. MAG313]